MYHVDLYRRVRLVCHHDGLSHREAAHRFGIDRKAVSKILKHSTPPSGGKSPLVILLNSFLRPSCRGFRRSLKPVFIQGQ